MTTTRQVIIPADVTIFGTMNTDPTNGDDFFNIAASASCRASAKFAAPRSPQTNAGSTLNNVILNFTVVSGTLASVTPTLTRIQYQNGVAPASTTVAITPPVFTLTTGAINRGIIAINVPAIDNQATTLTVCYVLNVIFTATAGADVRVQLSNIELDYTYASTGSVLNGSVAVGGTLAALAAGSRTSNNRSGTLVYTGINDIAAGATDTLTIVNTSAGTHGIVTIDVATAAGGSSLHVGNVVWTQGASIAVTVRNGGAAGSGAAGALTFHFLCF